MKRYGVKSVPEKLALAAIILSCGLVMHAPPVKKEVHTRYTGPLPHNYVPAGKARAKSLRPLYAGEQRTMVKQLPY